ncbi:uncharacterized protein LOC123222352 [Mangifera indica]|uniref:uncharacterized protein LOC123222352 n=1 Tax=Mangifera indica TaxID=29780 RepID=UPI001CFAC900|nr:uncharacterized protein LOC123222352 [Mangifera indica]
MEKTKKAWTEDQEISILTAMIQFSAQGLNPSAYLTDFYAFIKRTQSGVDFSQNELQKKLMEMRNNYKETLIKSPAEIVSVSDDTHQKRILNLSKQIWGGLVSAQVTSETCLKEMRKFYEKNVRLGGVKVMKKKDKKKYEMKLREIERMEMKLNLKRAEIVKSQTKFLLEAYDEIMR